MNTAELHGFGTAAVQASVAGRTHPGRRRRENQDNFLISDLSATDHGVILRPETRTDGAVPETRFDIGERGVLCMIADGMGGAAAGRLASGLACTFVVAEMIERWSSARDRTPRRFASCLSDAVNNANTRIHQHALRHPETAGMGSTVTACGVSDRFLFIAQVGDSRAYLVRANVATLLTRDQSLVQEMIDAGAISERDAERSERGNVILQALGVRSDVSVDLTYQELRRNDSLVLCSDGLHRLVSPEEIAATVGRGPTPDAVCHDLITMANARGGADNITVVAVRFGGAALPEPRADDYVRRTTYAIDAA
ncbi:MAG: PP2C family protein-serine/threonine phosphatase [Longimicrobiales bacterium]